MKYIVLDIDHTIAIPGDREKYFLEEPINIAKGEETIMDDKIIESVRLFVKTSCLNVIVLTARHETSKLKTIEWLDKKCDIRVFDYFCKPENDTEFDSSFKERTIDLIIEKYGEPFVIFEDREDVIEIYKKKNLNVLQVHHKKD